MFNAIEEMSEVEIIRGRLVTVYKSNWGRILSRKCITCARMSTYSNKWRWYSSSTMRVMSRNIPKVTITRKEKWTRIPIPFRMKSVSIGVIPSTIFELVETHPLPFPLLHTTNNTVPSSSIILLLRFIIITTTLYTLVATLFTLAVPWITMFIVTLNTWFVTRMRAL